MTCAQKACLLCAGLPVPTQEIVDAVPVPVQAILGLMPPPKLAAAAQKIISCCPEARAAPEEQVLVQDIRPPLQMVFETSSNVIRRLHSSTCTCNCLDCAEHGAIKHADSIVGSVGDINNA